MKYYPNPGFQITRGRGFKLKFANGYTLSVQFGPGNYCDNYDMDIGRDEREAGERGSTTAEVAVLSPGNRFVSPTQFLLDSGGDDVIARVSPETVAGLASMVAMLPKE